MTEEILSPCVFCAGAMDLQNVQELLGKNVCGECYRRVETIFFYAAEELKERRK